MFLINLAFRFVSNLDQLMSKSILRAIKEISKENFQEVVSGDTEEEEEDDGGENDIETGRPAKKEIQLLFAETSDQKILTFPTTCAICLDDYSEGGVVIFSSNDECHHAFHQDCILEYLAKSRNVEKLCPCCRQPFCLLSDSETELLQLLVVSVRVQR